LEKNPTWLLVVAALIRDARGRLLLQQALPGKPHAGQWEFPGGKVESGENPRFALRREIAEELGLRLDEGAMAPAGFADDAGLATVPTIVLVLYDCARWEGEPHSREGQAWGWFTPAEAAALPLPAIDRALFEGIAKPGTPSYVAPFQARP
jgi:8-oxo-dGTP diphosphatase